MSDVDFIPTIPKRFLATKGELLLLLARSTRRHLELLGIERTGIDIQF